MSNLLNNNKYVGPIEDKITYVICIQLTNLLNLVFIFYKHGLITRLQIFLLIII